MDVREHKHTERDCVNQTTYLKPCDFSLRGPLKANVYRYCPQTTDQLKAAARRQSVANITTILIQRVIGYFQTRSNMRIRNDGHQLDDIV
ncbi:hypothetical protein PR048_003129 [Dryococelus australis]|uniref:Uncharacterized protein n=1 Tax=Dryococelus australis TaxID=614101 RepID=A0ABQ9IMA7_9NEOP|nr:hypothetical protein PR048_003129 [Dryococelus australis]